MWWKRKFTMDQLVGKAFALRIRYNQKIPQAAMEKFEKEVIRSGFTLTAVWVAVTQELAKPHNNRAP